MAAPVIAAAGAQGYSASASVGIPVPTGVVNGSKIVVYTFAYWSGSTVRSTSDMTPPSGFTAGHSRSSLVFGASYCWLLTWWWKDATGADTGTYTFAATGAGGVGGYALRIAGSQAVGTSPFVDTGTVRANGTDASSSTTIGSFTPGANDSLLLAGTLSGAAVSSTGWAFTQAVDADGDYLGYASLTQTTAAALNPTFTGGGGYIDVLISTLRGVGVVNTISATPATITITGKAVGISPRSYLTGSSINRRYLVDQAGQPFLAYGDSPWLALQQVSLADWITYLDNRVGYGTNVVYLETVGNAAERGRDNGTTYDGLSPFGAGFTPDATYWARMDSFLAAARDRGVSVWLMAIPFYSMTGASTVFHSINTTQAQAFGAFLANRYPPDAYPGIVWFHGGDYDLTTPGSAYDTIYDALITGIKSTGDTRPHTVMLSYYHSLSTDTSYWEQHSDINGVYTYYPQYKGVLDGYARAATARDPRPVVFTEGSYEEMSYTSPLAGNLGFRKQFAWSLTSGGSGVVTGHDGLWAFETGWQSKLDTPAQQHMAAIVNFFRGIEWWKLVPDTANTLVTAGRGSQLTSIPSPGTYAVSPDANSYVTAARSYNRKLAVIYNPDTSANSITIAASAMGPSPTLTRVDPTNGSQTSMTWTTTPGDPGANAGGDHDWLFLITSATSNVVELGTPPVITIVGQTVGVTSAHPTVAVTPAAVTVTGSSVTATGAHIIAATVAAISVTGQSVNVTAGSPIVPLTAAAITLIGMTVGVTSSQPIVSLTAATISITGQDVTATGVTGTSSAASLSPAVTAPNGSSSAITATATSTAAVRPTT